MYVLSFHNLISLHQSLSIDLWTAVHLHFHLPQRMKIFLLHQSHFLKTQLHLPVGFGLKKCRYCHCIRHHRYLSIMGRLGREKNVKKVQFLKLARNHNQEHLPQACGPHRRISKVRNRQFLFWLHTSISPGTLTSQNSVIQRKTIFFHFLQNHQSTT